MSPSPNQTHLLCWRWSSGFRGNKSVVGFIRPLGKAPRLRRETWLLASPRVPSSIAIRGLDRFRYTPLLPAWPALRSVKGRPLPSPSTPPRPPSSWIRHSQPSMPRGRTGQRCGVATDCSLSADRQPESGTRPTTHRDGRRFSQPGGLPFAVGESRGLVSNGTPGAAPHGNAAGACAGESGCPLLPLSSLEFSPSPQPVWCTVPDPPLSLLLALVTRFRSPNEKKMLK